MTNTETTICETLTAIAREHLDIETLQTRNRDQLDFYDCAVWTIQKALEAAFKAGHEACRPTVFSDDLRIDLLEQYAQTATCAATRLVAHTAWVSSEPIATLRQLADATASAHLLSPHLAAAAQELLRRLRLDDRV